MPKDYVAEIKALIDNFRDTLSREDYLDALDEMSDLAMIRLSNERESDDMDETRGL